MCQVTFFGGGGSNFFCSLLFFAVRNSHVFCPKEKSFQPYLYGIKCKTEERETAENASTPKSSAALERVIEGAGTKAECRALEVGEST